MLQIKDLEVAVDNHQVLHGVNLQIPASRIQAVMGPNGSGKSTLAATLAGHPDYQVNTGQILLNDRNILDLSPDQRAQQGILLAFQSPVGIPGVSLQNFLRAAWEARFGQIHSPSKNQASKNISDQNKKWPQPSQKVSFQSVLEFRDYLAKKAKLINLPAEFLSRPLDTNFSGGERKKIEMLQLLALQPQFAILDETDSGLDIDAIQTIARAAQYAQQNYQTGLLIITHYQRILDFIKPDQVHILVDGQVVESGQMELVRQLEKEGYQKYKKDQTWKQLLIN